MEFKLQTREQCQKIVESSETFYCTSTVVEGFNVEMYDYRLASFTDFENNNAYELRGLTFVYNPNTNEWERNILLNKFFNCNQTINWMYEDLKDKKVIRIQDKLDGSLISFVKFPNGVVRAKSKMSFTSDQAIMAQEIYDTNSNIRVMVNTELERGHVPIFELVGSENQIVLEYKEPYKLVLLQIRSNETGEYFNKTYCSSITKQFMVEYSQTFQIEEIAQKYTINDAKNKIGGRKFNTLQDMLEFLSY